MNYKKSIALGISTMSVLATLGFSSLAQAADSKNVSLVLGVSGSPFYEAMACGAKAEAKIQGLRLTVTAASQFDGTAQTPIVNAVTAKKPAVAIVVPTDAQVLFAPLKSLVKAGIKLITADQTLKNSSIVSASIVTDNFGGGKLAAVEMNRLLGGKGEVLVITQPPGSSAQDARVSGFESKLKAYSGITYLGPQYASDDPAKVAQIIVATLAAHPNLAGVFASNDQSAIGAITGLNQAKKAGKVKLIGYDAAQSEVDGLKNGTISALIAQNPAAEGRIAMQTARALINKKSVKKSIFTALVVIRAGDNAAADKYVYKAGC